MRKNKIKIRYDRTTIFFVKIEFGGLRK